MGFTPTSVEVLQYHTKEDLINKAKEVTMISGSTEYEREIKDIREKFIKGKILTNQMLVFRWAIGHVDADGSSNRVNGQHSSHVFLELTDEEWAQVRFPIWITEEHYHCDTLEDRAFLFNQFDPRQSSRSNEDNIGVHTAMHADLKDLDRYSVNKATQGLLWFFQNVEGVRKGDAAQQFRLVHQNGDIHRFLIFSDSLLSKTKTAELAKPAVVAAMFHTTRHGSDEAYNFWRKVATASILDPESYEARLGRFLECANKPRHEWSRAERSRFANNRKPNDREIFQACLRIYRAKHYDTPNLDPVDRLRDRTVAQIVERYAIA